MAIAVAKFIVAFASGSSAMLSESIHSTVDTLDQLLLLLGIHLGKRPPDVEHPFGHGQEIYFWSLIVSVLIFGVGGGMSFYEGLTRILGHARLEDPTWNYVVLGIAACFEGTSFLIGFRKLRAARNGRSIWRTFRESKDPSLLTVVFEDSAALCGLALAFCGVFFGHLFRLPVLDGIASMAIGLLLVVVAALLARESRSLLLGEAAGAPVREGIEKVLREDPAVERAGGVLTMHFGPDEILLNVDVQFRRDLDASELEAAVDRLESRIREGYPKVKRIFLGVQSFKPAGAHPH